MNSYIEEYFELTGRPIATMTVDEYIKLKSITGIATEVDNRPKEAVKQVAGIEQSISKENAVKTPKATKQTQNTKDISNTDKKAAALSMLRSVEG